MLGFHYYRDTGHFDEPSLDYWLPKLQAAGTRWLVIYAPETVEIPEEFIARLHNARIEPILVLEISLSQPPSAMLFQQRMSYYRKIGIHMVQFFNRPNMRDNWEPDEWMKPNLVTRFTRRFATYAQICVNEKIIPVYPLLERGGDYWDLAWLKTSIKILNNDYGQSLLPHLVFSVSAALDEHPAAWNQGGPAEFGQPVPYRNGSTDHRGFFGFEWYRQILTEELGKNAPMILELSGQWYAKSDIFDVVTKESRESYLKILNMVQCGTGELPGCVLACCMYKLPSSETVSGAGREPSSGKTAVLANTPMKMEKPSFLKGKPAKVKEDKPKSVKRDLFKLLFHGLGFLRKIDISKIGEVLKQFGTNFATVCRYIGRIAARGESLTDYFLFPEVTDIFTEDQLAAIGGYVKLHKCKAGKSLDEALASGSVVMLNNPALYPDFVRQQLQDKGCAIKTISLDDQGE